MPQTFHVVDLFAGPGGLAEGFSAYRHGGHQPFNIVLSVEKEASAHRTLRLRSFLRQFDGELPPEYYLMLNDGGDEPDWAALYPAEWENACEEALRAELGSELGNRAVAARLKPIAALRAPTVVIGGPPCQAYSLVGRARNQGNADYVPEQDGRHFLYQEYIEILETLRPAAFVMENVKGILTSSVQGTRIFSRVLADLRNAGGREDSYQLFGIGRDSAGLMILQRADAHEDFLLMSEQFGVPQTRHRVIVVGIRADLAHRVALAPAAGGSPPKAANLRHVLAGMPRLRAGLSPRNGVSSRDREDSWKTVVLNQMERAIAALRNSEPTRHTRDVIAAAEAARETFSRSREVPPRGSREHSPVPADCPEDLREWLQDPLLRAVPNHHSRSHMDDDLSRYFFSSIFAQVTGRSAKAYEFPADLAPQHANWTSGVFADRFRAQPWGAPATTITSHISKDGHYFIHPDPLQCRALTVREAARLQTFPDNYLFLGNRTEQYVQVGNAVPPFLARQLAAAVWAVLGASQSEEDGLAPPPPAAAAHG